MFSARIAFVLAACGVLASAGPGRGAEGQGKRPAGPAESSSVPVAPPAGESSAQPAASAGKADAGRAGGASPKGKAKAGTAAGEAATVGAGEVSMVHWRAVAELPVVPGQTKAGRAGVFAGALDAGHAVVAGGTYYEGKGPLEGGERTFTDAVQILSQSPAAAGAPPEYAWSAAAVTLPQPLAYGASVTLEAGVLLIGGTDGTVCVPDVRLLAWDAAAQKVVMTDYPALPKPLAFLGAGRVGTWVIVAGGTTSPDGRSGADVFGLDLATRDDPAAFVWQTLPALPVAVHFPIVVGEESETGGRLHVFGGRDLRPDQDDRVLSEGWAFDPAEKKWSSSGPIKPEAGAPAVGLMGGTAVALEERRLLVLGGDDGELARLLERNARRGGPIEERESYARLNAAILGAHPGHRRGQLLFDARQGGWRSAGHFPEATPAVTPAFLWDGAVVLIGGEPAPGRRSAKVWIGTLESE